MADPTHDKSVFLPSRLYAEADEKVAKEVPAELQIPDPPAEVVDEIMETLAEEVDDDKELGDA